MPFDVNSFLSLDTTPQEATSGGIPPAFVDYSDIIDIVGDMHPSVPKEYVAGLLERESTFRKDVTVDTGDPKYGYARGMGQFIDETAARYIPEWRGPEDSYDPVRSIQGTFAYLEDLQKQEGNIQKAIGRYLGGGGADKFGTTPESYAQEVLGLSQKYIGAFTPTAEQPFDPSTFVSEKIALAQPLERKQPIVPKPEPETWGAVPAEPSVLTPLKVGYVSLVKGARNILGEYAYFLEQGNRDIAKMAQEQGVDPKTMQRISGGAERDVYSRIANKGAELIGTLIPEKWEREIAEAGSGTLNPKENLGEAIMTLTTAIADQTRFFVSHAFGEIPAAIVAFSSMGREFRDSAHQHGFTDAEIDKYYNQATLIAGSLEYAGEVALGGFTKKVPGLNLGGKFLNLLGSKVVGKVAMAIGAAEFEGLTEYSQQAVYNHYLGRLARDRGMSEEDIEKTFANDPILASRDFWIGALTGGVVQGNKALLTKIKNYAQQFTTEGQTELQRKREAEQKLRRIPSTVQRQAPSQPSSYFGFDTAEEYVVGNPAPTVFDENLTPAELNKVQELRGIKGVYSRQDVAQPQDVGEGEFEEVTEGGITISRPKKVSAPTFTPPTEATIQDNKQRLLQRLENEKLTNEDYKEGLGLLSRGYAIQGTTKEGGIILSDGANTITLAQPVEPQTEIAPTVHRAQPKPIERATEQPQVVAEQPTLPEQPVQPKHPKLLGLLESGQTEEMVDLLDEQLRMRGVMRRFWDSASDEQKETVVNGIRQRLEAGQDIKRATLDDLRLVEPGIRTETKEQQLNILQQVRDNAFVPYDETIHKKLADDKLLKVEDIGGKQYVSLTEGRGLDVAEGYRTDYEGLEEEKKIPTRKYIPQRGEIQTNIEPEDIDQLPDIKQQTREEVAEPNRTYYDRGQAMTKAMPSSIRFEGVQEPMAELGINGLLMYTDLHTKSTIAVPLDAHPAEVVEKVRQLRRMYANKPIAVRAGFTNKEQFRQDLFEATKQTIGQFLPQGKTVTFLHGDKILAPSGRVLENFERTDPTTGKQYVVNGRIVSDKKGNVQVWLNAKSDITQLVPTMAEETIGHYGAASVLKGEVSIYREGLKLFNQDHNSDYMQQLEKDYESDLNEIAEDYEDSVEGHAMAQQAQEQFLFNEWVGHRTGEYFSGKVDETGVLRKDAFVADKKSMPAKVFNLIKDFFKRIISRLSGKAYSGDIESFARRVIKRMPMSQGDISMIGNFTFKAQKQMSEADKLAAANEALAKAQSANTLHQAQIAMIKFARTALQKEYMRKQLFSTIAKIKEVGDDNFFNALDQIQDTVAKTSHRRAIANFKRFAKNHLRTKSIRKLPNSVQDFIKSRLGVTELSGWSKFRFGDDVTTQQIIEITNDIKGAIHDHKFQQKLIGLEGMLGKAIDRERAVEAIIARKSNKQLNSDVAYIDKMTGQEYQLTPFTKSFGLKGLVQLVGKWRKASQYMKLTPETICNELDGWNWKSGIFTSNVYNQVNDGSRKQYQFKRDAQKYFDKNFKVDVSTWSESFYTMGQRLYTGGKSLLGLTGRNIKKDIVKLPNNRAVELTPAHKIAVYLHSLNNKNMLHVTHPDGGFELPNKQFMKLSVEDIQTIVDSLTKEERHVGKVLSDYLNIIQKDALDEIGMRLLGHEVANEPNYFPALVSKFSLKEYIESEITPESMINYFRATTPGSTLLKERTGKAVNPIVLEDAFEAVARVHELASRYIGLAIPLRDVRMFLNDVRGEMRINGLEQELKELDHMVKRVAGEFHHEDVWDKAGQVFFGGYVIGKLGFGVFSVAPKQVVSVLSAPTVTGKFPISPAFHAALNPASFQEVIRRIDKYSPETINRLEGFITRDIGELLKSTSARELFRQLPGKNKGMVALDRGLEALFGDFARVAMRPTTVMDSVVIVKLWLDTEAEARAMGLKPDTDELGEYVARETERVVRWSQPTWHTKDRARIASSGPGWRFLTMFYSQLSKDYNMYRRMSGKWNTGDKQGAIRDFFILSVMQPLGIAAIGSIRRSLVWDEEDWEKEPELARFFQDYMMALIARTPIASLILGGLFNKWRREVQHPVAQTMTDISTLAGMTLDLVSGSYRKTKDGYKSEPQKDRWKEAYAQQMLNVLSDIGVPTHNVKDVVKFTNKLVEHAYEWYED